MSSLEEVIAIFCGSFITSDLICKFVPSEGFTVGVKICKEDSCGLESISNPYFSRPICFKRSSSPRGPSAACVVAVCVVRGDNSM